MCGEFVCISWEEKRICFVLFCLFVTKFGEDFDSPVMDFMSSHYVSLE